MTRHDPRADRLCRAPDRRGRATRANPTLRLPRAWRARDDSDLDLLIIETEVADRAAEMVRLRRVMRPLRIPVDTLVYSRADVERWGDQPGSALFWALREGEVMYG